MTHKASGTFTVKLTPQSGDAYLDGTTLARLTIDKVFQGDLVGSSKGQMMSAVTAMEGSAGYVAIEQVNGTLHGRSGSFVLQHSSTLHRGVPQQSIQVVPDSATGELQGLKGRMVVSRVNAEHHYDFEFEFAE